MKAAVPVMMVFVGCMSNVIFLEAMVKEDPGSGNLITCLQFILIALEGLVFTSKFGTAPSHISKKEYFKMVMLFFLVNLINNYAFNFNVPVPLHIIFRSGSLITNMLLGVYVLKNSYKLSKYISVLLITIGIIISTVVSGKDVKSTATTGPPTTAYENFFWWCIGIFLLTLALFLSAYLGLLQESIFKKYGKHPREALFYTHMMPLPFFLFISKNIYEHALIALESEPVLILNLFKIPKLVLYLIGNALTQHLCISSVYNLTSECSSLVVTLVLTLRKFASLIFSVIYFKNVFTVYHTLSTILVLIGTVIFTDLHTSLYNSLISKQKVPNKKAN